MVAWYIGQRTDLHIQDDFDNWFVKKKDTCVWPDMYNISGRPLTLGMPVGDMDSAALLSPDLTSLIETQPECQPFFTLLRSPNSNLQIPAQSQPYVLADLNALMPRPRRKKVQDILSQVKKLTVHPEHPTYAMQCAKLATPRMITASNKADKPASSSSTGSQNFITPEDAAAVKQVTQTSTRPTKQTSKADRRNAAKQVLTWLDIWLHIRPAVQLYLQNAHHCCQQA